MTVDVKWEMRANDLRRQMMHDPDLTGDTLLLALCILTVLDDRRRAGRAAGKSKRSNMVEELVTLANGDTRRGAQRGWWVKHVIAQDVPRYEVDIRERPVCEAPMIRRDGPCGQRASESWTDYDPETGEGRRVGVCRRHMTPARHAERAERMKAWTENGKPHPPPNAGGVLARYFETDWSKWYEWAAPYRTPADGAKPATPPRPQLRLIVGEG